jgi:hypothetical protein
MPLVDLEMKIGRGTSQLRTQTATNSCFDALPPRQESSSISSWRVHKKGGFQESNYFSYGDTSQEKLGIQATE